MVAAGLLVDPGGPAELAHDDDQGLLEQPALVEVFNQSGEALVEHGEELVLQPLEVLRVGVPAVADGHLVEVDGDHRDAGLGQPAGQQHRLAEAMVAVPVADPRGLRVEGEGLG